LKVGETIILKRMRTEMTAVNRYWPLRVGLLFVSFSWFSYMLYEFANGVINRGPLENFFILVTDVPQCIGLGFRTAAGFIAVVTILFYIFKKDLSQPEALMALRLIVLFEACYWFLSFFMSGVLGAVGLADLSAVFNGMIVVFIENTLPCLVQSFGLTAVLLKLFLELSPNKPAKNSIKWGLIAGTFYAFVFWLNNTGNYIAAIIEKGTAFLLHPSNLFSFFFTTGGLLLIAIYAAYFSKKSIGTESLSKLNLHIIGAIITLIGLYFSLNYVMWIFLGSVGGWGTWYAWIMGHNLDLWAMSLPFVGLPLLYQRRATKSAIQ